MRIGVVLASVWLCIVSSAAQAHGSLIFKGSEGGAVHALVTAPGSQRLVYAATSQAGVFRSDDGGEHWRPVNQGLDRVDVLALAGDSTASATLYAGTRSGLYKTTDGGAVWRKTNPDLGKEQVKAVLLDPDDHKTLYAGTYHGLWKSSDAGVTWLRLAKQPENPNITALAIARDAPHSIYAGTADGFFYSRDGGATWLRPTRGLTVQAIATLVMDPLRPQTLYAGTGDGAYKSEDGGETWKSITFNKTNLPVTALLIDPRHPDTIYLGTSFVGGLFKTEDGGKSWVRIQGESFTPSVTALAFSPDDPKGLIAGTSFYANVFVSPDAGMTWKRTPDELALPELESIAGAPDGESLFAAAQDGLYRFDVSAQRWNKMGDTGAGSLSKVAYLNRKNPRLWVCGSKGIAEGRASNGAWHFKRQALAGTGCVDLVLDEKSGHVLAATKTGLWSGPGHWQRRAVPAGEPLVQLALGKGGNIYALSAHRALRSADAGKTWEQVGKEGNFVFTAVAETGAAPALTWLSTSSDISYSAPGGKWINASQGMFPPGAGPVAASPDGGKLYAASMVLGRVFMRKANEEIWSASDLEDGGPDISGMWLDPSHEGVLYVATRNSGLFHSGDHGMHWHSANAGLAKQ